MNYLLRLRIWPSFLASSGVGTCDVPFRYASKPTPRDELPGGTPIFFALAALRSVPHRKRYLRQAGSQFRGLATLIREISGLRPFPVDRNKGLCYRHTAFIPIGPR